MKIAGKYDERSVEITGTADSLSYLARAIQELIVTGTFSLFVPSTPPAPYHGYVHSLTIEQGLGNVYVSRSSENVCISGSAETLAILASNIDALAYSKNVSDHIHIEYHPKHFYLKEESVPLVVTKCVSAE